MSPKLPGFLIAATIALVTDLGTKAWVLANVRFGDRIPVIDEFFYLSHVRNPGAAFGLFATSPDWVRKLLFIGVAIVALLLIVSFYRSLAPGDRFSATALGMILGGALGNLTDRVRFGEVVDFLHFRLWGGYTWPDFNFADSFIVVGVILLVLELLATEGESRVSDSATHSET